MNQTINSINNPEAQPQAGAELGEFSPLVNPELALQTYESFAGGPTRKAEREAFMTGDTYHLVMTYPDLNEAEAQQKGQTLQDLRAKAIDKYGPDSITVSSIDYRIKEAEFLQVAAQLNNLAHGADKNALQQAADRYVLLNDQLYGKPDQRVVDTMLADLRQRYTNDDPRVQKLWSQLQQGFSLQLANGEQVNVPALVIPQETAQQIPQLSDQAKTLLAAEWKLMFPAIVEARGVLGDVIAAKQGLDIDYDPNSLEINRHQTAQLFRIASLGIANQHNSAPFNVEVNEAGTAASWESDRQAVVIGLSGPDQGWSEAREVGVHESMHGLKSSNGLKSGEPAMATGVFTRNPDGTYTDYLTFEEGNNNLGEKVLSTDGELDAPLKSDYNYYLMSGLIYRGLDDRQVKEVFEKLITIERLSIDPSLDVEAIRPKVLEQVTIRGVVRVFRGTPTDAGVTVDGHMPIFTKDLAYPKGRRIATEFWNQVATDAASQPNPREYFHEIFEIQAQGKVDPTDPVQYAAAKAAYQKRQA